METRVIDGVEYVVEENLTPVSVRVEQLTDTIAEIDAEIAEKQAHRSDLQEQLDLLV